MGYTVILPTLNEKGHIVELVREIQTVFSSANEEYEIIVVDDTSEDGTIDLIKKIENDHNNLKLFVRENLKRNLAKSINRQFLEVKRGGASIFVRKIFTVLKLLLLTPSYFFALPILTFLYLIRPWFLVRFSVLPSSRLGHFAENTELYLSNRTTGQTLSICLYPASKILIALITSLLFVSGDVGSSINIISYF